MRIALPFARRNGVRPPHAELNQSANPAAPRREQKASMSAALANWIAASRSTSGWVRVCAPTAAPPAVAAAAGTAGGDGGAEAGAGRVDVGAGVDAGSGASSSSEV